MTAPVVTMQDLESMKVMETAFSRNFFKNYEGGEDKAKNAFKKAAGFFNGCSIFHKQSQWEAKVKVNAPPAEQAKALLDFCSAALPVMKKAFGEDVILQVLPAEVKEQRMIDLCRAFGNNDLAAFCEKARGLPQVSHSRKHLRPSV
ncbi:MAG: hypothetical protein V1721_04020 [Pseudomonadota bacterium]